MATLGHVFLVDDDHDIRLHLGNLLRQLNYSVSDFPSAQDFLRSATKVSPSVLLLDMRMPSMSGLELHKLLTAQQWQLPVIYMSGESHSQEIIDAMKGGAAEFLWKPFELDALLTAVESAMSTDAQQLDQQQLHLHVQALYSHLSVREKELLPLLLQGMSNKSIAAHTGVLADTVKKHRAHILAKMQVDNLASLLQLCKGFVPH